MAGGQYTALSGMRTWLGTLDRLASDIANASTAGYKAERAATTQASRPTFGAELQSAIDVSGGQTRLDLRGGALAPTGRGLDLAIEGSGFFAIETTAGPRFTRNGRFMRREDGVLATPDGDAVMGESGPIKIAPGDLDVSADGSVRSAGAVVGRITVVDFDEKSHLVRESALRLRNDGAGQRTVERPSIKSGTLEQSNVSIVDRLSELTSASRSFESLQKALSVLMNDVDSRAISELGRR